MTDNSKVQKICQHIYKDFTTGKRVGTLGDFISTLDEALKKNNIKIDALEISTTNLKQESSLERKE
jgi:hypothetical protein